MVSARVCRLFLEFKDTHCIQDRAYHNGYQKNWGHVFDNHLEQTSAAELGRNPHFVNDSFGLDHIAHKNTDNQRHNRHDNTIGHKIGKVENRHANPGSKLSPNAKS